MIAYFETSAVVKLIVEEQGSEAAGALWDGSDLVLTSRLTYAEVRAALAAAHRAGRVSSAGLRAGKRALEERFEQFNVVELTGGIVRSAGDLCEAHALRGYDAVHLASAMMIRAPDLVMTTWDRDLANAARTGGLNVAGIQLP